MPEVEQDTESLPSTETPAVRALPVPAVLALAALAGLLAGAIPVQLVLRGGGSTAAATAPDAPSERGHPDLRASAESGDLNAMIELAIALWQCAPAERDLVAAGTWLERAAEADPRGADGRRATRLLGELRDFERNLRFDASSAELSD